MSKTNHTINWISDEELVSLVNKHTSIKNAAKELGVAPNTLSSRLKNRKLNFTLISTKGKLDFLTNEEIIEIVNKHRSITNAAKEIGCKISTLNFKIHKNNLNVKIGKVDWVTNQELISIVNGHKSYAQAAKELKVSEGALHQRLEKMNIKNETKDKKQKRNTKAIDSISIDDLINLVNNCESYCGAASVLGCGDWLVASRIKKSNSKVKLNKRFISCNENAFTNNDDLSYYLLGVYITDGCVGDNDEIELSSKDKDWLESISRITTYNAQIRKIKNTNNYALRFKNTNIANWLKSNECVPRKSLIAKFPIIPEKYYPDFIRGVFDGDGSISLKLKKIKLKNKSNKKNINFIS